MNIKVTVPDIGDFKDVPVIEVLVKPGQQVKKEDPLVTLESDKATMDVPAPATGTIVEIKVKVGDKVSEGSLVVEMKESEGGAAASAPAPAQTSAPATDPAPAAASAKPVEQPPAPPSVVPSASVPAPASTGGAVAFASPSIRHYARTLGVNVREVKGTGPKGRIVRTDVEQHVKSRLSGGGSGGAGGGSAGAVALGLLPWPQVDFSKFGEVARKPLSRIKKLSGANLARNWMMIPHVTQFDEADITDLENFRKEINKKQPDAKLTVLAFLLKATVSALKRFPDFNASVDGEELVMKNYFHLGFAADTPQGLTVPVIRNVDQKGVLALAAECGALAAKARAGKLTAAEMQGGCFTISSLGGIGGTAFTPIINAPEVAILGVSRSSFKPQWDGASFVPRLMLPLSLSFDHRVVDGAAGAHFTAYLSQCLTDMRRVLL